MHPCAAVSRGGAEGGASKPTVTTARGGAEHCLFWVVIVGARGSPSPSTTPKGRTLRVGNQPVAVPGRSRSSAAPRHSAPPRETPAQDCQTPAALSQTSPLHKFAAMSASASRFSAFDPVPVLGVVPGRVPSPSQRAAIEAPAESLLVLA